MPPKPYPMPANALATHSPARLYARPNKKNASAVKSVAMKNPMRGLRRRKYTPVKNMQMSDTNVRTVTTTEPPTSPTPGISTI